MVISSHWVAVVYIIMIIPSNFPLNVSSVRFRLIGIYFDHCKDKFKFSFFAFSLGYMEGSEVTVGSEDPLQNFFKGHICSRRVKWNTF